MQVSENFSASYLQKLSMDVASCMLLRLVDVMNLIPTLFSPISSQEREKPAEVISS